MTMDMAVSLPKKTIVRDTSLVSKETAVPFSYSPEKLCMEVTGDLTVIFGEIEENTPAGTYKVFKIDMTSNNIQITLNTPPAATSSPYIPTDITMNCEMDYQVYLEYGTLHQIKADMQQTAIFQSSLMNYTSTTTTETTLNQHIKP